MEEVMNPLTWYMFLNRQKSTLHDGFAPSNTKAGETGSFYCETYKQ